MSAPLVIALPPGELPAPFVAAATARHGTTEGPWETALRELVQRQLEIAVLRLADAVPGMLDTPPAPPPAIDLVLPLPAGERLRFTARLERVA